MFNEANFPLSCRWFFSRHTKQQEEEQRGNFGFLIPMESYKSQIRQDSCQPSLHIWIVFFRNISIHFISSTSNSRVVIAVESIAVNCFKPFCLVEPAGGWLGASDWLKTMSWSLGWGVVVLVWCRLRVLNNLSSSIGWTQRSAFKNFVKYQNLSWTVFSLD